MFVVRNWVELNIVAREESFLIPGFFMFVIRLYKKDELVNNKNELPYKSICFYLINSELFLWYPKCITLSLYQLTLIQSRMIQIQTCLIHASNNQNRIILFLNKNNRHIYNFSSTYIFCGASDTLRY